MILGNAEKTFFHNFNRAGSPSLMFSQSVNRSKPKLQNNTTSAFFIVHYPGMSTQTRSAPESVKALSPWYIELKYLICPLSCVCIGRLQKSWCKLCVSMIPLEFLVRSHKREIGDALSDRKICVRICMSLTCGNGRSSRVPVHVLVN